MRDAARLLPVLGLAALLLPDLVLSGSDAATGATRPWLVYLFAAWAGLIILAIWIAHRIRSETPHSTGDEGDAPGGAP